MKKGFKAHKFYWFSQNKREKEENFRFSRKTRKTNSKTFIVMKTFLLCVKIYKRK